MKIKGEKMKNVQKVCWLLVMSVLAMVFYAQAAGAEVLVDATVTFPGLASTEKCTDPYVIDYSVPGTGGVLVTKYMVDPYLESYMPAGSRHSVKYQYGMGDGWSGWSYGLPYCCGGDISGVIQSGNGGWGGGWGFRQNGIEITTQGFVTGIPLYNSFAVRQEKRPIDKVQVAVNPGCGAFSGPLHQDGQEIRLIIEFIPDSPSLPDICCNMVGGVSVNGGSYSAEVNVGQKDSVDIKAAIKSSVSGTGDIYVVLYWEGDYFFKIGDPFFLWWLYDGTGVLPYKKGVSLSDYSLNIYKGSLTGLTGDLLVFVVYWEQGKANPVISDALVIHMK